MNMIKLLNWKRHSTAVRLLGTMFILLAVGLSAHGQTVVVPVASGTTYTTPANVTKIKVEVWGAGGGTSGVSTNKWRGGAGGGAYTWNSVNVSPGTSYSINIGTGGSAAGTAGGDTYWVNNTTLMAKGGSGNTGTDLAAGGQAAASIPASNAFSGGSGAATGTDYSGGGGGGAGSTGPGKNATNNTAGGSTADNGGAGGNGNTGTNAALPGNVYGGGAGGAYSEPAGGNQSGATGGNGLIRVTYSSFYLNSTAAAPACTGLPSIVTITSDAAGLPDGNYTITYTLTGDQAGSYTASVTVSGNTGTFSTINLTGATNLTITNIASALYGNNISGNNTAAVSVSPSPTITLGTNPSVCSGLTSANLTYSATTGTPNQYMIDWNEAANTAGFLDVPYSTLPSSPIVLTVPGTAAANTYNGTLKVRNSGGGCESIGYAISVTINAIPTITLGTNPSVCAGVTSANLAYSAVTGAPNQYAIDWDAAATTAGFTDLAYTSLPASPIALTLPVNVAANTYNGILKVKNNTTGCESTGYPITVTVNALPTITLGANPTVCSGVTSASLPYSATTGTPTQYTIDWNEAANSAGFADVAYQALGASPILLTVPGAATGGTYNGTLKVKNTTTGCESTGYPISVTVIALPTITLGANPAVCRGVTSANLTYSATTGTPTQYSIDWSEAANLAGFTDVNYTSLPSSPVVLAVPGAATAGTYTGTLKVKNTTTTCESIGYSISVTINALPTITLGTNPSVCISTTTAILPYTATTGDPNQYSIDWNTTANSAGFTDVTYTTLPANQISLTLPANAAIGTYNGILKIKNSTTTCESIEYNISVSVISLPTITLGTNPSVCRGLTTVNLAYTATAGSPDQYTIDWNTAAEGAGFVDVTYITLPPSPIVLTVPGSAATATYSGTLKVRNSTAGCESTGYPISVTVIALPTITLGTNPTICSGVTTASLTYSATTGTPNQYTIDWNTTANTAGFTDVTYTTLTASSIVLSVPGTLSAGTYNGTLKVKNTTTTCESEGYNISVNVTALPTITLGTNPSVCRGVTSASLSYSATTGDPTQYTIDWNSAANTAGFADVAYTTLPASQISLTLPANAAAGTYNGVLRVRNTTTTCVSNEYPISVTLTALPTISLGTNPSVCQGLTVASLTYSATTGTPDQYLIDWNSTAEGAGFVDVAYTSLTVGSIALTVPGAAAAGTYSGTLKVRKNGDACESVAYPISVIINALPANPGNPTSNSPQCEVPGVTLTRSGTPPAGVVWYWQTSADGTSTAFSGTTYTANASGTFYIRARNSTTLCWSSGAGSVTVVANPLPTAPTANDVTVYFDSNPHTATATPPGGSTLKWFTAETGGTEITDITTVLTKTAVGVYTAWAASLSSSGCLSATRTLVTLIIKAEPRVDTFNASGQFVVPAGVTSLKVQTWGGGGGGGYSVGTGGGGGAFATLILGVIPGETYHYTIGAAGNGGTSTNSPAAGLPTTFRLGSAGPTLISAAGGLAAGNGGSAAACIPTTGAWSGGNGAAGSSPAGGGGGGSALATANGGSGSGTTGGTGQGNGGNGGAASGTAGTAGITPGGGGGGGGLNATGGNGASGRVVIIWDCSPYAGALSGIQSLCLNQTTTFTSTVPGGTWSSSNPAIASINSATGLITALSAGTATMTYTVNSGGLCAVVSATRTITVIANNTIVRSSNLGTDNQTACYNTAISNIRYNTTGATGAIVSGLPAGVNGVWSANVVTISGSPTQSGTFSYTVTLEGGCGSASASGTITVRPEFTPGAIVNGGETICYGGSPSLIGSVTLASGGNNIITYSWRSSADNYTNSIIGATSASYIPPANLTATTSYRRYARDGVCKTTPEVSTGTWTVTVLPAINAGSIQSTGQTICYGGIPSTIGNVTAASAGGATVYYSWRSSVDNYTVPITGATLSSYTPPVGLTSTRTYRRYASTETCVATPQQSAGEWTVTVRSQFSAGSISTAGQLLCHSGNPDQITSITPAGGGNGQITYSWRSSLDNEDFTNVISGATSATYTPPAGLTVTTHYRRYAKDGLCNTDFTPSAGIWTVYVLPPVDPGAIQADGEMLCTGGTPGPIGSISMASGGDGDLSYLWKSSADGFNDPIPGAINPSYTPPAGILTTTTYHRYVVDGACPDTHVKSDGSWTVDVLAGIIPGAIRSEGQTICIGDPILQIGSISAAVGGAGTITYSWRSSADNYTAAISGATSATYTPPANLSVTTTYRRYAQDAMCAVTPVRSTGEWTVTVLPVCSLTVEGTYTYHNNTSTLLPGVTVELKQGTQVKYSMVTGADGKYKFASVNPGTYTIVSTFNLPTTGAVNALDAGQVNAWGVGPQYSIEKARFMAGDVVADDFLNAADASAINIYYLNGGFGSASWPAQVGNWKFWKAGDALTQNDFDSGQHPVITVGSVAVVQNMIGIATGDFNRSFLPALPKSGSMMLTSPNTIQSGPGEEVILSFTSTASMNVGAFSLSLEFPADLIAVRGVYLGNSQSVPVPWKVVNGQLRISWFGDSPVTVNPSLALFNVSVAIPEDAGNNQLAGFRMTAGADSEIGDATMQPIRDAALQTANVMIASVTNTDLQVSGKLSFATYPNPAPGYVNLRYSIPTNGEVSFEIFNQVGQKMKIMSPVPNFAGEHDLRVELNDLVSGVYLIRMTFENQSSGESLIRRVIVR
jgi:large repetitive protein